jgi:hypothetical protein
LFVTPRVADRRRAAQKIALDPGRGIRPVVKARYDYGIFDGAVAKLRFARIAENVRRTPDRANEVQIKVITCGVAVVLADTLRMELRS